MTTLPSDLTPVAIDARERSTSGKWIERWKEQPVENQRRKRVVNGKVVPLQRRADQAGRRKSSYTRLFPDDLFARYHLPDKVVVPF